MEQSKQEPSGATVGRRIPLAIAAIATVALVGVGITAIVRAQEEKRPANSVSVAPAQNGILVDLIEVQSQLSQDNLRISGQVEAYRVAMVAAEVGERVVTLPIDTGTRVTQGSLIAQLNDTLARAQVTEAEAELQQAIAGRRQAEAEYARADVETDAARQAARAQIAQAEAGEAQARAQVIQAAEGERKAKSFTRTQELQQAEAALRQAKADEELQKAEFDRYAYLLKEGAVGQQVVDRVKAAYTAATAKREAAEQDVSLAKEGARQEDIQAASAQVAQANAAVANFAARRQEAEATLRIANTRDVRLATLLRHIDSLKAQEARAAAALVQARILQNKHRIAAPFTGRVLVKLTEVGEMLSAGTPITRIGEIGTVKVRFQVPEAARLALRPGLSVTIRADALPGRTFSGSIETVGYQADSRARTFPVEVRVTNLRETLLPNMVARLELPRRHASQSPIVPISAVASDGKQSYVFVVEEGRAVRRDVTTGPIQGDRAVVTRGLSVGDSIIATPQRLTEGATVRVRTAEEKE